MAKQDKLITDPAQIESIMNKARVLRLAMTDGEWPYVIPMNFGYASGTLYLHTGLRGKKIDLLRRNPKVCFALDADQEIVEGETACQWTMKFRSVVGYGRAELLESPVEKRSGLDVIMKQYSDHLYDYPDDKLSITSIVKIRIERMTALVSGDENL